MSLYIGHLSPHTRREELERVFWRFGRCSVQLKDGYGFVIYEVTANAVKALRVLRGKNICGEQISLNWSNRQPKPFQKSARESRDNRYYEPYRRNFKDGDNGIGTRGFNDRRYFSEPSHARTHNRIGRHLDDVPGKEAGHIGDNVDETITGKGVSLKEGVVDEGGSSELNPLENDRWGEPAGDALYSHELGNSSEFDRYEPYYHRRETENNQMASPYGSKDQKGSQERGWREHSFDEFERGIDKSRLQQSCYNRGHVGHIMRSCSHGDSKREKFSKINHRRSEINFRDTDEGKVKKLRSNSRGRPNICKESLMSKRYIRDRKEPTYKEARRVSRTGSGSSSESREKGRPKPRAGLRAKKKWEVENGIPKKALKKRVKRSATSSLSSDSSSTRSQSQSKSLGSTSDTSSDSRSRSPSSRSPSKSYANSLSSRSSSSFLRSPSLSVSLDKKPSSPEKVNVFPNAFLEGNLEYFPIPESQHHLEISEPVGACSVLKGENELTQFKVDYETNEGHQRSDGHDAHHSSHKIEDKEHKSCSDMHKYVDTSEYQGIKCGLNRSISMKSNVQVPVRCGGSSSTRMSTQEMLRALRHYGLPTPAESESNILVERYFGAARLWPWEVIYYRRLKKGPISKENYDRRLEQNKEYGIVDKYIRSSSGWGECDQFGS